MIETGSANMTEDFDPSCVTLDASGAATASPSFPSIHAPRRASAPPGTSCTIVENKEPISIVVANSMSGETKVGPIEMERSSSVSMVMELLRDAIQLPQTSGLQLVLGTMLLVGHDTFERREFEDFEQPIVITYVVLESVILERWHAWARLPELRDGLWGRVDGTIQCFEPLMADAIEAKVGKPWEKSLDALVEIPDGSKTSAVMIRLREIIEQAKLCNCYATFKNSHHGFGTETDVWLHTGAWTLQMKIDVFHLD